MPEPIELTESREANALLRSKLASTQQAIVRYIAEALTASSSFATVRWTTGLATALDGAGLNIDTALDEHLAEQGLSYTYLATPTGMNRREATWTDMDRKVWDLSKTWVDRDGVAWKWTGDEQNGEPMMRKVTAEARTLDSFSLGAISIFDGPLTALDGAA